MDRDDDIKTLVQLILKRINIEHRDEKVDPKVSSEQRVQSAIDFLGILLRGLSKGGNKDQLASYFGLSSMTGILYEKKITGQHILNALLLIFNCEDSDELISMLINYLIEDLKRNTTKRHHIEWFNLDRELNEDEMLYLVYCGKKYKQMKDARKDRKKEF